MKSHMNIVALLAVSALSGCSAFGPAKASSLYTSSTTALAYGGYIPDGLSVDEYKRVKEQDKKKQGKDLGRLGPRGFKSRSMQAWQEAFERGETGHHFAPLNYKQQLKQGKIRKEDVPYMVRGGSWDNSDVGQNRVKWSKTDREYAKGGYKKEQSVSILGSGPGFNWTGEKRDAKQNSKWLIPGLS